MSGKAMKSMLALVVVVAVFAVAKGQKIAIIISNNLKKRYQKKGSHAMMNAALNGKPHAGNPHVRFEVGGSRIGKPRRGSLLYNGDLSKGDVVMLVIMLLAGCAAAGDYGVCAHLSRTGEFEMRVAAMTKMKAAGIDWCRTDFDWGHIEPKEGVWSFDHIDALLADADRIGMTILPILDYEVPWAYHPWSEESIDKWRGYVRRVVAHCKGRCPVWEVWNEQNCDQAATHPFPNPKEYARLLKVAAEEIRVADPKARVAIGGFAGVPFDYIEGVYKADGKESFDIMNVHPYQGTDRAEGAFESQFAKLKALMAKYGDEGKPIWATEIGLKTCEPHFKHRGLLAAALRSVDVGRHWRVLYVDRSKEKLGLARKLLADEVCSKVGTLSFATFPEIEARISAGGVDAIVFPFSEEYPLDALDVVYEFVKRGGVLVDMGGMAMFKPVTWKDSPGFVIGRPGSTEGARRFRFENAYYYSDRRIPLRFASTPTGMFKGRWTAGRIEESRCFRPCGLKKGDAFEPLLVCQTNGLECATLACIRYGSDMKGVLVLGGFFERGMANNTEEWQGKGCARQLNQGYAMGYEKIFWYEFQQMSGFGITRRGSLDARPAYMAYQTFVSFRPSGSVCCDGEWRSADGDLYFPRWRRPDGREAGAMWSVSRKGRAPDFARGATDYRDWMGQPLDEIPDPLPDAPVYFLK